MMEREAQLEERKALPFGGFDGILQGEREREAAVGDGKMWGLESRLFTRV